MLLAACALPLVACAWVLAACCSVACAAEAVDGDASITLDTPGGDAWTFSKLVTGRVVRGLCDQVVLEVAHSSPPRGAAPTPEPSPASDVRSVTAARWADRFSATVRLETGANEVRAVCIRAARERARSAAQRWRERLPDVPRASVGERITAAHAVHLDGDHSLVAPGEPAAIVRYEWRARAGNPGPLRLASGAQLPERRALVAPSIDLRVPSADGNYFVTLRVTDRRGRADESVAELRVVDGQPREALPSAFPEWAQGATIYGAAVPLHGQHALRAITQQLAQIRALGVRILWLSPVTGAPQGDFGYAVTDGLHVRSAIGTDADLRELVGTAHSLGLRVILDLVVNHLSDQHPYYEDAERRGPRSAYYQWFERDAGGQVAHYFDWRNLENLNYADPEVQNYLLAVSDFWLREYSIDGFRVDAAWAVRERAPQLWRRWRAEVKRIEPDALLVAEASARDPYYLGCGFDAAYDWTLELGHWAWSQAFASEHGVPDLASLRAALTSDPGAAVERVVRFINDNDTGARFITRHGPAETRLAASLLLTLPGLPVIYDGDEVGAAFEPYDSPRPAPWSDRDGLRSLYVRLGSLRLRTPALRAGTLRLIPTDHDETVLAFARAMPEPSREPPVVVVLNWAAQPVQVHLARDPALLDMLDAGGAEDLLSGAGMTIDPRTLELRIPGRHALLLRARPRQERQP